MAAVPRLLLLLSLAALPRCDGDATQLAREITEARGDCDAQGLKASDEACVQMMQRYAEMTTEAIRTYIGAVKALDVALGRMPPAEFDTAGIGHALSVGPATVWGDAPALGMPAPAPYGAYPPSGYGSYGGSPYPSWQDTGPGAYPPDPRGYGAPGYRGSDYYDPRRYGADGYDPRGYDPQGYDPRSYDPRSYDPRSYDPRYPAAPPYGARGYGSDGYDPRGYGRGAAGGYDPRYGDPRGNPGGYGRGYVDGGYAADPRYDAGWEDGEEGAYGPDPRAGGGSGARPLPPGRGLLLPPRERLDRPWLHDGGAYRADPRYRAGYRDDYLAPAYPDSLGDPGRSIRPSRPPDRY
jgi:hypothetical protein